MAAYTTVDDPEAFFNTKLYTGSSSTPNAITGVGFEPDMVWTKNRDYDASHRLHDVLQGPTYSLVPDYNYISTTSYPFSSFDTDGYTINTTNNSLNSSSYDYVSWCWIAGTTTGIAGSPTITPTSYSFNQAAGFSIVAYTANNTSGATIPHGLGVIPDMAIIKCTSYAEDWTVYHTSVGILKDMNLDIANAASVTDNFYDTLPTSTLFYMNNGGEVNESTRTYQAYFFKAKQGYSRMGKYTGNGDVDGPFVFTGFRPAFILIKEIDGTNSWFIFDNKRLGYNNKNYWLQPDNAAVETLNNNCEILSNGFKFRSTNTGTNADGLDFLYYAIAESPFVNSEGVPNNARGAAYT